MVKAGYIVLMIVCLGLVASTGHAQTVLQVPYDAATFSWDAPASPPPAGSGPTEWYLLNCGGADVRIDAPATSVPVRDVLAGPGSYTCSLKAASAFGVSAPSNAVTFESGYRPADIGDFRIEVR